jgi:hypothetical protein
MTMLPKKLQSVGCESLSSGWFLFVAPAACVPT